MTNGAGEGCSRGDECPWRRLGPAVDHLGLKVALHVCTRCGAEAMRWVAWEGRTDTLGDHVTRE